MDKENSLVSIIVRTKDRPVLLKRALQSIAAQTYRQIEVVLVNDGGCDLDIDELKAILGDITLNYIRLGKNTGRAHAANVGIENVHGNYIGFLDDDDEFYPEHVFTLISFLKESEHQIAYSDSLMVHSRYHSATGQMDTIRKELVFSHDFNYDLLIFENYIPLLCLLFKRETLLNSTGFDESFNLYEDWDLLIRLGERYPFYHIRKTTAEYNQWSAVSQISQWNIDAEFLEKACLKVFFKHRDKFTPLRIHDHLAKSLVVKKLEHGIHLLSEKEREVQKLEAMIREREDLINEIISTKGWRMLQKYRRLRDGLLSKPLEKKKDSLLLKGIRTLRFQGIKAFVFKVNKKLLFSRSIKELPLIRFSSLPIRNVAEINIEKPLEAKISVIIPTKNAGDDFEYTLRKMSKQEGVREIELIIIDSGSRDRTVDIAREFTENVFQIVPDDFHHARTRNFGAEMATGDFLVFTVQDAIPVGSQWLYKLISPLSQGLVSAVSARQIPRSDSDFFAVWSYWNHDLRYLGNDRDRVSHISPDAFQKLGIQEKRSLASLDNVCLGIAKKTFDLYLFHSEYAEDFELGVRLISEGHPLMFQSSNAVIHSHNQPPLYYFKRSYADTLILSEILHTDRKETEAESVMGAISYFYAILKTAISELRKDQRLASTPEWFIHSLINLLYDKMTWFNPMWHKVRGDHLLDEYFRDIPFSHKSEIVSELYSDITDKFYSFSRFMRSYGEIQPFLEDFVVCLYKIFCIMAGNYLGMNTRVRSTSLCEGI